MEPHWEQLFARRTLGVTLGLESVRDGYRRLGAPARELPAVQVVGTNGKGSVAVMCAHGLAARGRRVGLYTSPHLHRVGERIRIAGEAVDDPTLWEAVERVLAMDDARTGRPALSFFEILTLAALLVFRWRGVDCLVIEAGLGARLDATSILDPCATVVTPIAMDHEAYLGTTLAAIAGEKAAALRTGVPVFCGPQHPEARAVLQRNAQSVGTALVEVDPLPRPPHGLAGEHQRFNGALALAAASVLEPRITAGDLDGVQWPGRFETLTVGGAEVLLDVAHNLAGIEALVAHLQSHGRPLQGVVVGLMPDKPVQAAIARLGRLGVPIGYVQLAGSEPAPPGVHRCFRGVDDPAFTDMWDTWMASAGFLCVCGSHQLVAPVRARLLGLEQQRPDPSDPLRRHRCFGAASPKR